MAGCDLVRQLLKRWIEDKNLQSDHERGCLCNRERSVAEWRGTRPTENPLDSDGHVIALLAGTSGQAGDFLGPVQTPAFSPVAVELTAKTEALAPQGGRAGTPREQPEAFRIRIR